MPTTVVKTKADEKLWSKAKAIVRAQGYTESDDSFWQRVMAKFKELKNKK